MGTPDLEPLTLEEVEAEHGKALPTKNAMSVVPLIDTGSLLDGGPLLNLNLDLDLDADIAAPIDAAIAANANVAVPIDAAVSANVLSGSAAALASADQDSLLTQHLDGAALATADQDVELDQSRDDVEPVPPAPDASGDLTSSGALLDLNADLDLNLDLAAPIDAAIAANANVAAPIDAAVSANILSGGAQAIATAPQDSVIVQELDGVAVANASQGATIDQSDFDGTMPTVDQATLDDTVGDVATMANDTMADDTMADQSVADVATEPAAEPVTEAAPEPVTETVSATETPSTP